MRAVEHRDSVTPRNLGREAVSATSVRAAIVLCAVVGVLASSPALAQTQPETGYELALSGPSTVRANREARFRGVAYRVRGLSTLDAFAGPLRIRFRSETTTGAWR